MSEKEYSKFEQKLYNTPHQEAAFLSGAFQTVSAVGIAVGAGWVPSLAYMIFSDRYFSTPFREDKDLRNANLKGWAMGFATSLAVMYGVNSVVPEDMNVDSATESQFEQGAIVPPIPSETSPS